MHAPLQSISLLTLLGLFAPAAHAQIPGIGPKGAVTRLFTGFTFTEGPAQDAGGNLYFSDVRLNTISKVDTASKLSTFLTNTNGGNGIYFSRTGRMIVARGGAGDVVEVDVQTKVVKVLAGQFNGKRFNGANDLVIDVHDGVWFTDPNFSSNSQPVTGVYYLDAANKVTLVVNNIVRPNGILLSPREDVLYVASTTPSAIMAYPITAPGQVGTGSQLFALGGSAVDGMTIDTAGNLYLARSGLRRVEVVTPSGTSLGNIAIPEQTRNCCFGGPNMQTLFVTAGQSLYRADMISTGHRPMRMTVDNRTLPVGGGRAKFTFVSTPFDATRSYILAASATGDAPGFTLQGTRIPLQFDPLTDLSIQLANSSVFVNSLGTLDASGAGSATFAMPSVGAAFIGRKIYFASLRLNPFDGASNAITIELTR